MASATIPLTGILERIGALTSPESGGFRESMLYPERAEAREELTAAREYQAKQDAFLNRLIDPHRAALETSVETQDYQSMTKIANRISEDAVKAGRTSEEANKLMATVMGLYGTRIKIAAQQAFDPTRPETYGPVQATFPAPTDIGPFAQQTSTAQQNLAQKTEIERLLPGREAELAASTESRQQDVAESKSRVALAELAAPGERALTGARAQEALAGAAYTRAGRGGGKDKGGIIALKDLATMQNQLDDDARAQAMEVKKIGSNLSYAQKKGYRAETEQQGLDAVHEELRERQQFINYQMGLHGLKGRAYITGAQATPLDPTQSAFGAPNPIEITRIPVGAADPRLAPPPMGGVRAGSSTAALAPEPEPEAEPPGARPAVPRREPVPVPPQRPPVEAVPTRTVAPPASSAVAPEPVKEPVEPLAAHAPVELPLVNARGQQLRRQTSLGDFFPPEEERPPAKPAKPRAELRKQQRRQQLQPGQRLKEKPPDWSDEMWKWFLKGRAAE
jgi:hypothetical protein